MDRPASVRQPKNSRSIEITLPHPSTANNFEGPEMVVVSCALTWQSTVISIFACASGILGKALKTIRVRCQGH